MMANGVRHFLDLTDIPKPVLAGLIDRSRAIKAARAKGQMASPLAGKTLAMVFDKPSTRTRVSFDVAMRWDVLLLALVVLAGPAWAELPADCGVAAHLAETSYPLPKVKRALADKKLNILVVGAGSSQLPGANGTKNAYPARLQQALADQLKGVDVKVTTDVKATRTAAEMVKTLPASLAAAKPELMVWQTGTTDAMRAVDPDQFSQALDAGINVARGAGADVVLVNAQYSPRTESMIALSTYSEDMSEYTGILFAAKIGQRLARCDRNMRVERQPVDELRLFAERGFLRDDRRQVGVAHASKSVAAKAVRHLYKLFAEDFLVKADDRVPFIAFEHDQAHMRPHRIIPRGRLHIVQPRGRFARNPGGERRQGYPCLPRRTRSQERRFRRASRL